MYVDVNQPAETESFQGEGTLRARNHMFYLELERTVRGVYIRCLNSLHVLDLRNCTFKKLTKFYSSKLVFCRKRYGGGHVIAIHCCFRSCFFFVLSAGLCCFTFSTRKLLVATIHLDKSTQSSSTQTWMSQSENDTLQLIW